MCSNPGATTWHRSPRLPTGRGDVTIRVMSQICNKSMAVPAWSTGVMCAYKLSNMAK